MNYAEFQESVAGRPPKRLSYADELLLMFRKEDGTYCGKFKPVERWYNAPHRKLRQQGLIKAGPLKLSIMGSRGEYIWFLTDKGKAEVEKAYERHKKYKSDLEVWGATVREARKRWREMHD